MGFLWCTIDVADMEESLEFYQDVVGLSLEKRFAAGPKEIAFLDGGQTKIELIYDKNEAVPSDRPGISLGFEVESISNLIRFLSERGYEIKDGPYQPNPHIRFLFINDPNGLKIQFVENLG